MTLWTPNPKTVDPIPLCQRCGKLRRDWHRANRARLGVGWLHGVCCCGNPCETENPLTVTISNANSTACPCKTGSGTDRKNHSIDADGSYSVPFQSWPGGNVCTFLFQDNTGVLFKQDRYSSSDGSCSGSLLDTFEFAGIEILIQIYHPDNSIYRANVTRYGGGQSVFRFAPNPSVYFFGDSIPTEQNCSTSIGIGTEDSMLVVTR